MEDKGDRLEIVFGIWGVGGWMEIGEIEFVVEWLWNGGGREGNVGGKEGLGGGVGLVVEENGV